MAYGAARPDVVQRALPAVLELDAEAGLDQLDVGTHDPGQQNVAHSVADRIRPVDPALLHQSRLQPEFGRHGRNLPGVVRLDAADGDEGVGSGSQCIWHEVLELAGLVAAEGQAAVAVLALGPDLCAAEVPGQAFQRVNWGSDRTAGDNGEKSRSGMAVLSAKSTKDHTGRRAARSAAGRRRRWSTWR